MTDPPAGWVVVAVDQLLNLKPGVTNVYGPFATETAARDYSALAEETGTRLFVAALTDPAR